MNDVIRKETSKHMGEEVPPYPKGGFKKIYDTYNAMSKGEGFTRQDARHA
jgi:hypothetical protein